MKILCDFDGVLTDLAHEAERVKELFLDEIQVYSDQTRNEVLSVLERVREELKAHPSQHGWKSKGRITAFCNEDGFIEVNAMAACLDEWSQAGKGVPMIGQSYVDLAQNAYLKMTKETAQGKMKPVDPETRTFIQSWCESGHEFVVVSNSASDRIIQILSEAGLAPLSHETNPMARFRVRGGAQKFVLGNAPQVFSAGEYQVETDRPFYKRILLEEKPDAVIGDVFSLDLALPYQLVKKGELERIRLLLRKRPYTPEWSQKFISENFQGNIQGTGFDQLSQVPAFMN